MGITCAVPSVPGRLTSACFRLEKQTRRAPKGAHRDGGSRAHRPPCGRWAALNARHLHAGGYSGETCSASSRRVANLFFRCERRLSVCRTGSACHIAKTEKRAQKGRAQCALFCALNDFGKSRLSLL